MYRIAVIVLAAFGVQAQGKQLPAWDISDSIDKLADRMADTLFDRVLKTKASPLNRAALEDTTLGKPGHAAMIPQGQPASRVHHPFSPSSSMSRAILTQAATTARKASYAIPPGSLVRRPSTSSTRTVPVKRASSKRKVTGPTSSTRTVPVRRASKFRTPKELPVLEPPLVSQSESQSISPEPQPVSRSEARIVSRPDFAVQQEGDKQSIASAARNVIGNVLASKNSLVASATDVPRHNSRSNSKVSEYSLLASATDKPRYNEDAWFVKMDNRGGGVIAVADGVGSCKADGIDAGLYARVLSYEAAQAHDSSDDPRKVLGTAQRNTKLPGAATICMVEVEGTKLRAANLGDSGFRVIRKGKTVFVSPVLQHFFNCPYQLNYEKIWPETDMASSAQVFDFAVQPGDLVVVGSDGLFDNVFDDEIAKVATAAVADASGDGGSSLTSTKAAADALVKLARKNAEDVSYMSPFALDWNRQPEEKTQIIGGKMDDITVVVGMVVATADHATEIKEAVKASEQLGKSDEEWRNKAKFQEFKTARLLDWQRTGGRFHALKQQWPVMAGVAMGGVATAVQNADLPSFHSLLPV